MSRMSDSSLIHQSSPAPSPGEIDASCRGPVMALFSGAAVWLVVSAIAAMLASMSFHNPAMFSDNAVLSYGRILPFARTALLYGFCLPAAYGIACWLAARLGRTTLAAEAAATNGAILWNVGVLIGAVGILCGGSTGHEGFEIPRAGAVTLLAASLLLGYAGLVTIHRRTQRELYPSLWFIIIGLLWFPWILSTAVISLGPEPVRGVTQVAIQSWYASNLQLVVLGLFGLGALFYFVPKLAGKDLYSKHLAFLALVTLTFFGSWTGQSTTAPLPAWVGTISAVATLMTVVTAFAVIENLRTTCCINAAEPEARFFSFSTPFFLIALVFAVLLVVPALDQRLGLTLFRAAQFQALVPGFFCLIALGGIYHILPKVADVPWPVAKFIRAHLWLASIGAVIVTVAYALGGWRQGGQLADASVKFTDAAKSVLMPIRMASLGETLWTLGALLLLTNVSLLAVKRAKACMKCCENETAASGAEVKA
mgnify:CR=1 FL=1